MNLNIMTKIATSIVLATFHLILFSCSGEWLFGSKKNDHSDNKEIRIDAVFFAQTHVQQSDHEYFGLVGN